MTVKDTAKRPAQGRPMKASPRVRFSRLEIRGPINKDLEKRIHQVLAQQENKGYVISRHYPVRKRTGTPTSRPAPREIPAFASEDEEARFWETHDLADYWGELEPVAVEYAPARKQMISIRLFADTLSHIKAIAKAKGVPYQTLIQMWLNERIAQERGQG